MSKTKTLSRQRYRPVSEFDEVTLACKREYWRTKKREQRARLSIAKKTSRTPKTGSYKPVYTVSSLADNHVSDIPHSSFRPTLLSNGSYHTKESNVDGSIVKVNGVPLTKDLPVATAPKQHRVHLSNTETRQTQNRLSNFNDNISGISQPGPVPQLTPQCNRIGKQQIKNCAPPRSLASGQFKVRNDLHSLGGKGANANRKVMHVPQCSTALHRTVKVPMSEEEKAAKRRESWRIKKREQRAKRAEKLKKDRERMQCFKKGQQDTGKHCRMPHARSLFPVNTVASKGAKQHNSVMSVDLILSDGKPVHFTVKMESDILSSRKQQSGDTQGSVSKNLSPVLATRTNLLQDAKTNNISMPSGVSRQTSSTTHVTNQSKRLQHKFMRNQKRQSFAQGDGRVETAAERHAKQREYWRIKKREQRARLSAEAKARLKERATMRRRMENNVLEQTQQTRTSFQHRVPQVKNSMHANASETISGFIREDGILTVPNTVTPTEMLLPARSCSSSAVRSSRLNGPSVSQSQKLVCTGSRPALHDFPRNVNSAVNIHRRSALPKVSPIDPLVRSKLARSTTNSEVLEGLTESSQFKKEQRMTGKELGSCDSSTAVTPSLVSEPHDTIKQEPSYPSIESIYSLSTQDMDIKDIKPSTSPTSEAKAETEPSIGDSQATTLLVVASMKKLLEESLSSVVDSNTISMGEDEVQPYKSESEPQRQEETEKDINPIRAAHKGAVERDFSVETRPAFEIKQNPPLCLPLPQVPDFSAQEPVLLHVDSSILLPSAGTVPVASSCFAQGSGGERAKLPMAAGMRPLQRRTQGQAGEATGPQQCHPPHARGGQQLNEGNELQRKREYWRLMKRQQRARKAKEKERSKDTILHNRPPQPVQRKCGNPQIYHPSVAKSVSHTRLNSCVIPTTATSGPARFALSSTASASRQSSNGGTQLLLEAEQGTRRSFEPPQVKQWQAQVQGGTPTPPSRPNTVTFTQINHAKLSGPQAQTSAPFTTKLKNDQSHFKGTSNQELDQEEIVRRKRMHWRIKKQEQRARKAARERELSQQRTHGFLGPSASSSIAELVQSTPLDRIDFLPDRCQTMSFKEEAEPCFGPTDDCADDPMSEVKWRSAYLMDFDPVHQLLVCMVCGQQQYALSMEGARAHIEEAHPGTLALDERERQRILASWDEQVAVRERFFSSQLWEHGCSLKGENADEHTAEVEVILDPDDLKQASM